MKATFTIEIEFQGENQPHQIQNMTAKLEDFVGNIDADFNWNIETKTEIDA